MNKIFYQPADAQFEIFIVSPDGKIDLKLLAPDSKNMLDKAIDMAPGIIDKIKGFSSKKDKEEVTEE